MSGALEGRVALITGASRGSGAAMARLFAQEGADILLAARSMDDMEAVAADVRAFGRKAVSHFTDMADEASIEAAVARAVSEFGRLDILVNNAGGAGTYIEGGTADLLNTTTKAWDELLALNLRGPFIASRAAAKVMRDRGGGSIINIGSIHGHFTRYSYHGYSAAKAALHELTEMWAVDLGRYNIRVNEIAAGVIVAGRNGAAVVKTEADRKAREDMIPLGTLGTPNDIARVALFLASDESSYVSGAAIKTAGGWRGDSGLAPR